MKRFLVIKPSSLGDVLHAFPAVSALADSCKDTCEISWLIHPAFSDLLDYLPSVKKKIFFERKKMGNLFTFFPAFMRLFSALREEKYDAVYDLQGLMRSAFFSFLAKSPLHYGPQNPREKASGIFYDHKMNYPAETLHAVDKLCHMISEAASIPLPERYYHLPVLEKFRESSRKKAMAEGLDISALQNSGKILIAIAPGARWQSKTWKADFFAAIANTFFEKYPQCHFLLLGSQAEKGAVEALKKELWKHIPYTDLCGKTSIGELTELIRFSRVLLCNDSGPMHIAAFTDTLPVAFFGPTDPALTGPCCKNALVFQHKELPCIKCFKRECAILDCHKKITPEEVIAPLLEFLKQDQIRSMPERSL